MSQVAKKWKRLEKKVQKFNQKHPEAHIVCFGMIDNCFNFAGEEMMREKYSSNEAKDFYRSAVNNRQFFPSEENRESVHDSVQDALSKHCFDMDMTEMRYLIGVIISPPNSASAREKKRNFFDEIDNCPPWWRRTSVPFASLNHPKPGQKRATICQVYELIESIQDHFHIAPEAPSKKPRVNFRSRFTTTPVTMESAGAGATLEEMMEEETIEEDSIPNGAAQNSLKERRQELLNLAQDCVEDNCYQLLKILGAGDFNELLALSGELVNFMPEVPTSLAKEWDVPDLLRINRRYTEYIPSSVGKRTCLATSADGNCVFNAISIALYGNEKKALLLRLMAIVMMAEKVLEYSKYIAEAFGDEIQKWVAAVSGQEYVVPTSVSSGEMIEYMCQQELVFTAKLPYRDCTIFHLHMLSELLRRPVINHYGNKNLVVPYMENMYPTFSHVLYPQSVHVVWVPTKPSRYASLRHVVPAVCSPGPFGVHYDECAFEGLSTCAFMNNANPNYSPSWVECTLCGQWMHDTCIKVDAADIKEEDPFFCGCDRLVDGKFIVARML